MAEEVTAGEPAIVTTPGDPAAVADVEYRFPVEVEVRTTLAAADIDRAIQLALASLAGAVRDA
jgi:hypothetical protein